jgi:quercetin dioxygenase-like cupin family protein
MEHSAAAVVHPEDRPEVELPGSHGWVRVMIDGELGAKHVVQRVFRFEPGHTPDLHNEASEDVMYVVSGTGTLDTGGGAAIELASGTAAWVPPGVGYRIENEGPHDLVMLSVLSPPPGSPADAGPNGSVAHHSTPHHRYRLDEAEQPVLSAGDDRSFRVLVDPAVGARYVTQFVGEIEAIPAPPHVHAYEEAVHILSGDGTVEIEDEVYPIGPGSSVFLPPGVRHRLASTGGVLRLLGVFSPPGSPAAKNDHMTGPADI